MCRTLQVNTLQSSYPQWCYPTYARSCITWDGMRKSFGRMASHTPASTTHFGEIPPVSNTESRWVPQSAPVWSSTADKRSIIAIILPAMWFLLARKLQVPISVRKMKGNGQPWFPAEEKAPHHQDLFTYLPKSHSTIASILINGTSDAPVLMFMKIIAQLMEIMRTELPEIKAPPLYFRLRCSVVWWYMWFYPGKDGGKTRSFINKSVLRSVPVPKPQLVYIVIASSS